MKTVISIYNQNNMPTIVRVPIFLAIIIIMIIMTMIMIIIMIIRGTSLGLHSRDGSCLLLQKAFAWSATDVYKVTEGLMICA